MKRCSDLIITWKGKEVILPKIVNGHREDYHKTTTELKLMKLSPIGPPVGYGLQQYSGDIFYLYDGRETEPYKLSEEEKEQLKLYRKKLNQRKVCQICNKRYKKLSDIVNEYIPIDGKIKKYISCIYCNIALWEEYRRNEEIRHELVMQEARKTKHDFRSYFVNKGINLDINISDDEIFDVVYLDFETTGLSSEDEVLQVAIIDDKERVLLYKLCKPQNHTTWDDAMKINGITPADVESEYPFENYVDLVSSILIRANTIICYNAQFELKFINKYGVKYSSTESVEKFEDPMIEFSNIYGDWSQYYQSYKYQKLITAANYYSYDFEGYEHNSLADVFATKFISERMRNNK